MRSTNMCCFAGIGAPAGPSAAPSISAHTPNYLVRRTIAALVVVALVVVFAVASSAAAEALAGLGSRPAAASEAVPAVPFDSSGAPVALVHVARPGDTMWSIADQYRGEVSRDRYLDALISRNGGTAILAGQAVLLP
jgi:Tfp pilus assembly protein FimV